MRSKIFQKKTKIIQKVSKKKKLNEQRKIQDIQSIIQNTEEEILKSYYSNLIEKYKNNIKNIWDVRKEIIGKPKFKIKKLPHRTVTGQKKILDEKTIAKKCEYFFETKELCDVALKNTFSSLKSSKSPEYDALMKCNKSGVLKHMIKFSINKGILPENMKVACVTPFLKNDVKYLLIIGLSH